MVLNYASSPCVMEAGVWNPNRATHHDNHMSGWEKKKKKRSLQPGRTVFRLTRSDGSFTWRQDVSQGAGEEIKANFYCMCGRKKSFKGICGTSVSDGGPEGQNTTTFQFKEKEGLRNQRPCFVKGCCSASTRIISVVT